MVTKNTKGCRAKTNYDFFFLEKSSPFLARSLTFVKRGKIRFSLHTRTHPHTHTVIVIIFRGFEVNSVNYNRYGGGIGKCSVVTETGKCGRKEI